VVIGDELRALVHERLLLPRHRAPRLESGRICHPCPRTVLLPFSPDRTGPLTTGCSGRFAPWPAAEPERSTDQHACDRRSSWMPSPVSRHREKLARFAATPGQHPARRFWYKPVSSRPRMNGQSGTHDAHRHRRPGLHIGREDVAAELRRWATRSTKQRRTL
jgi:hypothetical protein